MPESAEQWLATFSEVRRQAARAAVLAGTLRACLKSHLCQSVELPPWLTRAHKSPAVPTCFMPTMLLTAESCDTGVQPPETDGQWYDVAEERTETSDLETLDETGAWRGLQWLNAFEILVRGSRR